MAADESDAAEASATTSSQRFWEEHYRAHARPWSGHANATVMEVAGRLSIGRALDLGCANGGDATWLAKQGWRVVGVDVSPTVIEVAKETAATAGVSDRVEFQCRDLAEGLPDGPFDLVTASFFHSPVDFPREQVLRATASRLTVGGVLLIIDHASVAPWSWDQGEDVRFPTPDESFAALGLGDSRWQGEILDVREREAPGPNGQTATVADNVIVVRRIRE